LCAEYILVNKEGNGFNKVKFGMWCAISAGSITVLTKKYILNMIYFIFNYALQPFEAYCAIWIRRSPPGVSTRVTTREHPAADGGTVGEKFPGNFA
jgi:hypothetical protein